MRTAREAIEPYVHDQATVIESSLGRVLDDAPDAIHATRVATRRLRSALVTFAPLWSRPHKALRTDLRWYASVLSRPRDLEVAGEWLARLAVDPAVISVPGAEEARAELVGQLGEDRAQAMESLRRELSSDRFARLGERLRLDDWSSLAEAPADLVVVALALAPAAAVAEEARGLPLGATRPTALHELRKSSKAARYAVDAIGATAHAGVWKQVTESLGVAQDAWVAKDVLTELGQVHPEHAPVWEAVARRVDQAATVGETRGLELVHTATTLPYPRLD